MPNNNPISIKGLIKNIESMKFNSEDDISMLKSINEAVEAMLVYAMTLNLSNSN